MTRILIAYAVGCALAVSAADRSQAPDFILDLTGAVRSSDAQVDAVPHLELLTSGSFARPRAPAPNVPGPSLPLTVTLVSLDKDTYDLGDEITYVVQLRNTGSMDVLVPTATQVHLFRRSMPGAVVGVLGLTFVDELLGTQRFAIDVLYGAAAVPNSFRLLNPSQTIQIQLKSLVILDSIPTAPSTWLRPVAIKAKLGMFSKEGPPYDDSTSINSITVQVNKPGDRLEHPWHPRALPGR